MSVKRCLLSRVKRTVVGRAAMSVHDPKRTSSVALILPFLLAGTRVRFEGWISMLSDLLDREEFFKKQTEECRDLARNAVNGDDREFWEQAAKRWNEQLRAAKRANRLKDRPSELQATAQAKLKRASKSCVEWDCGWPLDSDAPFIELFLANCGSGAPACWRILAGRTPFVGIAAHKCDGANARLA